MANKVTISNTDNKVTITPQSNTNIDTSVTNTPVTVTQGTTKVVTVNTLGPQGQTGPTGPVGAFNAGDDVIARHITASGNISSSGDLITKNVSASGDIVAKDWISPTNEHTFIQFLGDNLVFHSDNQSQMALNITPVKTAFNSANDPNRDFHIGTGTTDDFFVINSGDDTLAINGPIITPITASGNISASGGIQVGTGTFAGSEEAAKTDAALVIPINSKIYTLDNNGGNLRNLIGKGSDEVIDIGQNTIFINEIRLSPGANGFTSFYSGSTGTEIARIDAGGNITASGIISASGDIIAPRFIASGSNTTSGFVFPNPDNLTDLVSNRITLTSAKNMQFRAGGNFQFASIAEILNGNALMLKNDGNDGKIHLENAGTGIESRIRFRTGSGANVVELMTISGSGKIGIGNNNPTKTLTVEGDISGSGTGSFENLKLNYDNMPTSNPNEKGVIYRSSSNGIDNLLFISPG